MNNTRENNKIIIIHAAELFAKLTEREQQHIIERMKALLSER